MDSHNASPRPVKLFAEYKCGGGKAACAFCMVSCATCGEKGHSVDPFLERIRPGSRPRFACITCTTAQRCTHG